MRVVVYPALGNGMRILIVEDEARILTFVARALRAEGWTVSVAENGGTGLTAAIANPYDLVVLDLLLPGMDGLDLLRELRRRKPDLPVLILSARSDLETKLRGFKLGADDYLVKPFSLGELSARIESVLRRARHRTAAPVSSRFVFDGLVVDLQTREVAVGEEKVDLTAKEFDLLAFLAGSPRQVFSREQLLRQVWESSSDWQSDATITEHVRRLRRKIEVDPDNPRWITTVRGVGYRFEP